MKTDNKNDLKLGASLTVNQSWGSGSATATGSLNMEQTQGTARENAHKRMREQSSKLTTEIKQNYKSTFKTINETIETSSKRYLLNNTTPDLINYELRRKMRQVGVQVARRPVAGGGEHPPAQPAGGLVQRGRDPGIPHARVVLLA